MGYPENALADEEQVVLHRHPHVKRLIGPFLALLLTTACAAFVAGVVNPRAWDPTAKNVVFGVIWAVWLVVVGWLAIRPFLSWLTTHFVVTDRRVMFRQGLLSRSGFDVALARIAHVEFVRGFVDRIVRSGTLIIEPVGSEPLEFYDLPRVEQIHALLYREVFDGSDQDVFDNPSVGG